MRALAWRPLVAADLDAVMAIATLVHPAYPERRETFAEKLALAPDCCFALEAGRGAEPPHPEEPRRGVSRDEEPRRGVSKDEAARRAALRDAAPGGAAPQGEADLPSSRLVGYAVAYPWRARHIAPLDTLLRALPADADTLYVHDVALVPAARGHGHAAAVSALLVDAARRRGLPRLSLMAVCGADAAWRRLGFAVVDGADIAAQLAPYGPQARYMERAVG